MKRDKTLRVFGIAVMTLLMLVNITGAFETRIVNPTIIWNSPADITYGTALSSIQLNAVVTDPVTNAPMSGSVVYTPAAGIVLSAGIQTLKVDFTPTDTVNYNSVSKTSTINVLSNNGNGNGKYK